VRGAALTLALLLAVGAAACGGGDGENTFEEDGFEITFEYPGEFEEVDDIRVSSTAGSASTERAGVGLDEHNLLIVSRFDLRREVTAENVEGVKAELDSVVGQAAGRELDGERVTYGGLPGYEYEFDITDPVDARSRFIAVFDGAVEYTLNCQATEEKRTEVGEACELALSTLERSG
jgi:hypothetical protein